MKKTTLNVKIDRDLKESFGHWCDSVGLTPTVAVNVFIKAVLQERELPFKIVSKDPFYHPENIKFLKEGKAALADGRGIEKALIEETDETTMEPKSMA